MISYRKAATWVGKIRHFSTFSTLRSAHGHNTRKTLADIKQLYETKQPIAMVTAYDYISAQVCEAANADITLVGDSLAWSHWIRMGCGHRLFRFVPLGS